MNRYLEKHAYLAPDIKSTPASGLNMIIVIPARAEPDLITCLESILVAKSPKKAFELIIVFNHPENERNEMKALNHQYFDDCKKWIHEKALTNFHVIEAFDLNKKHAGVGLARKIGMDEAVARFGEHNGIIVALDADCTVDENYLFSIEEAFNLNKKCKAAAIYFEHPIAHLKKELKNGIVQYELHLRYYNQLLRYAGHPFAYHTIGSSMAVRSEVYQKQGGMNKRKAGEDFYFLQKIIQAGGFCEINSCCVYPSARISDRVPFGTGRAQGEWMKENKESLASYHPQMALELKSFFSIIEQSYSLKLDDARLPESVVQFIGKEALSEKLHELMNNTASSEQFIIRFYRWFNLFMCFKYAHFYRDNYRANIPVIEGSSELLKILNGGHEESYTAIELLSLYRKMDRK